MCAVHFRPHAVFFFLPVGVMNRFENVTYSTEDELESLQQGLKKGRNAIVYGKTTGPDFNDMHPFRNVASRFLQAVRW